jgi:hypothetical protein
VALDVKEERLRRMLDSELLRHISDESERLCDVLIGVLRELQSQQVSLDNQDAMDERRRKIRSALISFTSALQIHEYQTIRAITATSRHFAGRSGHRALYSPDSAGGAASSAQPANPRYQCASAATPSPTAPAASSQSRRQRRVVCGLRS